MSVEIYLHSIIRLHGVMLNEVRGESAWSLTNFPFSVRISLSLRDIFLPDAVRFARYSALVTNITPEDHG
jgi:hypothetical protein